MTKERKLEILKDLLIQLSDSANILCTCEADERCEVVEECIKALEQEEYYKDLAQSYEKTINKLTKAIAEQQPSDDCVSRKELYNHCFDATIIGKSGKSITRGILLEDEIDGLPPVTPTHGTCMDCKHNRPNSYARTMFSCENGHRFKLRDCENFYCADFEMRGTENG